MRTYRKIRIQSLIQESLSQNNVSKTSATVPATDDSVYSDLYEVDASYSRDESQNLLGSNLPPESTIIKQKFAEMQTRDRSVERSIRFKKN